MGPKHHAEKRKRGRPTKTALRSGSIPSGLCRLDLSAAIACDDKMKTVVDELNVEIRQLECLFEPSARLTLIPLQTQLRRTSRTSSHLNTNKTNTVEHTGSLSNGYPTTLLSGNASFEAAFDSLHRGVQMLHQFSGSEIACSISHVRARRVPSPGLEPTSGLISPPHSIVASPKAPAKQPKSSPFFETDPFSKHPTPKGLRFELHESKYGLIQERIRNDLFALVVQAILWNQTKATAGRPVLFQLLSTYPTPEMLANANTTDILEMIRHLGFQTIRSQRLVKMAKAWVDAPPCPSRRYGVRNYPRAGDSLDVTNGELLAVDDVRAGWEIAHLPGVGAYALDSYRIFYRDTLRGIGENDGHEPEWKRVIPLDKDLRPYLVWRWAQEGWNWDPLTGHREKMSHACAYTAC